MALHFSRSLIWSDFIEMTRFTFMYDGQIHSDVAPVTGGGGVRIDGDDGELLIDIPEWYVPSSDVNITLELGHKDWVLLGITYDDRYQLKPQDLVGLKLADDFQIVGSQLITGEMTPFIFDGTMVYATLNTELKSVSFKTLACNPTQQGYATSYNWSQELENVITAYTCYAFNETQFASSLQTWLIQTAGFQPSQIQSVNFNGYDTKVIIPIAFPSA